MDLSILIFITIIMSIIQISVWAMFPIKFRDIMMANPIFAFLANLAGSGLIAAFTGVASLVGICNLGASCVFGIYAWWYSKHKHIVGLGIHWYKLFGYVPICPRIMVQYQSGEEMWYL